MALVPAIDQVATVVVVDAGSVMVYMPVLALDTVLNVLAPEMVSVPVPAALLNEKLL